MAGHLHVCGWMRKYESCIMGRRVRRRRHYAPDSAGNHSPIHSESGPHQELCMNVLARPLAYIGLDIRGSESASLFERIIYALLIFLPIAVLVKLLGLPELVLF